MILKGSPRSEKKCFLNECTESERAQTLVSISSPPTVTNTTAFHNIKSKSCEMNRLEVHDAGLHLWSAILAYTSFKTCQNLPVTLSSCFCSCPDCSRDLVALRSLSPVGISIDNLFSLTLLDHAAPLRGQRLPSNASIWPF